MAERAPRFNSGRHAGVLVPLFSDSVAAELGDRRDSRSRRLVALARAGRARLRPVPAGQRDGGRAELAVFGAERDGHRSDLHRARGRRRVRGGWRRARSDAEDRGGAGSGAASPARRIRASCARSSDERCARAFERFAERVVGHGIVATAALREFMERERWWLDDYALFRALHDEHGGRYWRDGSPGCAIAIRRARRGARAARRQIRYYAVAAVDRRRAVAARADARRRRSASSATFRSWSAAHSADVWARQHEFRPRRSVGTPPDAFSATGQDWGLPVYRWDVIAAGDYEWLRERTRRSPSSSTASASITDRLLSHVRPRARRRAGFVPPDEPSQTAQGERMLSVVQRARRQHDRRGPRHRARLRPRVARRARHPRDEGAALGARMARARSAVPAIRAAYPAVSVATSGTHDTETLAEWWDSADCARAAGGAVDCPSLRDAGCRPRRRFATARATRCSMSSSPPARDSLILPSRTSSAGGTASTRPRSSTT